MSPTDIFFKIGNVQAGWATATVRADSVEYVMDGFSYITPAFDELARFGVDVALDAVDADVVLDAEPSGWILEFKQTFDPPPAQIPKLTFSISEMKYARERTSPRNKVLSVEVERDQLAGAILKSLTELESNMGMEAFEQEWMHAYPVRGIAALEAALATPRRSEPDYQ